MVEEKQVIPEGYKQTEVGIIPEDWNLESLSEMTEFITKGSTPTTYGYKWVSSGIPFLRSECVSENGLDLTQSMYISPDAHKMLNRSEVIDGDLLITITGNVGRIIILKNIEFGNINQHIAKIRVKTQKFSSEYIYHILSQPLTRKRYNTITTGQAYPQISLKQVRETIIPIPPSKTEQTAIARALSDIDDFITAQEKLIVKKKDIKTAAMQKLLNPYKNNGDLKDGWVEKTYNEIFNFLTTASFSRNELNNSDDCGCIHYGDIHTEWDSFLYLTNDSVPTISLELAKKYPFVKDGDIIMADASEDYDGVGKSIEIKGIGNKKIISGLHTFLLREKKSVFLDGFRGYLHSIYVVKKQFDRLATGLKVYSLSKGSLKDVILPVPPLSEQTHVADILSGLDTEIDVLTQKLDKVHQIKQGMMQDLLTGKVRLV